MDQADRDVGDDLGVAGLHELAEEIVSQRRPGTESAGVLRLPAGLVPQPKVAHVQIVAVVFEQFLKACARDVGQLDLHLLGRGGGLAALDDVLFARARGLDHLVGGAVALGKEAVTEAKGDLVDDGGLLVGEELPVVAARREKAGGGRTAGFHRAIVAHAPSPLHDGRHGRYGNDGTDANSGGHGLFPPSPIPPMSPITPMLRCSISPSSTPCRRPPTPPPSPRCAAGRLRSRP